MIPLRRFLRAAPTTSIIKPGLPLQFSAERTSRTHSTLERWSDHGKPIEEAYTPPSSWYTTQLVFEKEKDAIWKRSWLYAGVASDVATPGNYFTGWFAGEPYLVVRGDDSKLRAFYNVCRHRANILLPDEGVSRGPCQNCRGVEDRVGSSDEERERKLDEVRSTPAGRSAGSFQCGYHGWTYLLDGRLAKTVRVKGIKNFRPKHFGLKPIPCVERGPFVFLHFGEDVLPEAPDTADLDETWNSLVDFARSNAFPNIGSSYKWAASLSFDLDCNWKVFAENYLDGEYHIPFIHGGSLGEELCMDSYNALTFPRMSIQYSNTSGAEDARVGNRAYYAWLYPNFALNVYGNIMDTNHILPVSPSRSKLVYDFYFADEGAFSRGADGGIEDVAPGGLSSYIHECIRSSIRVQDEDTGVAAQLQRGLESNGYEKGRYAPGPEVPTHHFHQLVGNDLHRCGSMSK